MKLKTVRRAIGQINDAADMLEVALRRAQDLLQDDDCPRPFEQWDDYAEQAGFAAGDINCGDFAEKIGAVTDALELLAREIK